MILASIRFDFFELLGMRWPHTRKIARRELTQDDTRERRDFIVEMLARNPDAFSTEQDVQGCMRLFSERF